MPTISQHQQKQLKKRGPACQGPWRTSSRVQVRNNQSSRAGCFDCAKHIAVHTVTPIPHRHEARQLLTLKEVYRRHVVWPLIGSVRAARPQCWILALPFLIEEQRFQPFLLQWPLQSTSQMGDEPACGTPVSLVGSPTNHTTSVSASSRTTEPSPLPTL